VSTTFAPSPAVFDLVRFQTVTGCPVEMRWDTMPPPMVPSPMYPKRAI
jgi:hypothetical protein